MLDSAAIPVPEARADDPQMPSGHGEVAGAPLPPPLVPGRPSAGKAAIIARWNDLDNPISRRNITAAAFLRWSGWPDLHPLQEVALSAITCRTSNVLMNLAPGWGKLTLLVGGAMLQGCGVIIIVPTLALIASHCAQLSGKARVSVHVLKTPPPGDEAGWALDMQRAYAALRSNTKVNSNSGVFDVFIGTPETFTHPDTLREIKRMKPTHGVKVVSSVRHAMLHSRAFGVVFNF